MDQNELHEFQKVKVKEIQYLDSIGKIAIIPDDDNNNDNRDSNSSIYIILDAERILHLMEVDSTLS